MDEGVKIVLSPVPYSHITVSVYRADTWEDLEDRIMAKMGGGFEGNLIFISEGERLGRYETTPFNEHENLSFAFASKKDRDLALIRYGPISIANIEKKIREQPEAYNKDLKEHLKVWTKGLKKARKRSR
jgi:hypothetical protein